MANYVVGDVQGCFKELMLLLKKIKFNKAKDKLIFAGDLVNRGNESLEVLNFCLKNKKCVRAVLGNHDFYMLYLIEFNKKDKSLEKVLSSKKINKINSWLKSLPLLIKINIKETNETFWVSHAGIPFFWDFKTAKKLSEEVTSSLKNDATKLLKNMRGDKPSIWESKLKGYKRLRVIINYFTRMRFLSKNGALKLKTKDAKKKKGHVPWFNETYKRLKDNEFIVFGHWAALEGKTNLNNIIGVDTGCVWGKKLTAVRLEDKKKFHVKKK